MKETANDNPRSLGELLKASRRRLDDEMQWLRLELAEARGDAAKVARLEHRQLKLRLDDLSLRDCEKVLS